MGDNLINRYLKKQLYNYIVLCMLQVSSEDNVLRDGTLIDLCGATLVWRSSVGLLTSPVSTVKVQCVYSVS